MRQMLSVWPTYGVRSSGEGAGITGLGCGPAGVEGGDRPARIPKEAGAKAHSMIDGMTWMGPGGGCK